MAARSFDSADRGVRGVHRVARQAAPARTARALRRRLVVVAPGAADAVRHAGGWLFDKALAGWDVTVLTRDDADSPALRILGAASADLDWALSTRFARPRADVMALGADLWRDDLAVRQLLTDAVDDGLSEIRLWGAEPATGAGSGAVRHRLSLAARAFKAQALAAAAAPAGGTAVIETFALSEQPRPFRSA